MFSLFGELQGQRRSEHVSLAAHDNVPSYVIEKVHGKQVSLDDGMEILPPLQHEFSQVLDADILNLIKLGKKLIRGSSWSL